MTTALQVLDLGHGTYRLHTGERDLGWVAGAAIGFRGFQSDRAAGRAAVAAHEALGAWLARQLRAEAAPHQPRALRLHQRGEHSELTLGEVPIGWVMPMGGTDDGAATEFAFELRLPAAIDPALALSAARAVHAALDRRAVARRLTGAHSTQADTDTATAG